MDFKERHYSIDPGIGKKMDGCPYSTFEDGHDVSEFIIPPKGYVFLGFKFDPEASNQVYDGKLIAQYEKETFNEVIMSNLWKFLLVLGIIAIVAVVVVLTVNVFKDHKPAKAADKKPDTEVVAQPVDTTETALSQETDTVAEAAEKTSTVKTETVQDTAATTTEPHEQETPQPEATDPNVQFKQDFWNLIHQRTLMMDSYDNLYKDNKDKASGEEFDYLRHTILQDFIHFKDWSAKLRKMPASELENINTIADLKQKLKEIE